VIKLVCISNVELGKDSRGNPRHKTLPLTIGKVYECETTYTSSNPDKELSKLVFILSDNNGDSKMYHMNNFVTIDVWREIQLRKLDIK
jgi:hypothetical protein